MQNMPANALKKSLQISMITTVRKGNRNHAASPCLSSDGMCTNRLCEYSQVCRKLQNFFRGNNKTNKCWKQYIEVSWPFEKTAALRDVSEWFFNAFSYTTKLWSSKFTMADFFPFMICKIWAFWADEKWKREQSKRRESAISQPVFSF